MRVRGTQAVEQHRTRRSYTGALAEEWKDATRDRARAVPRGRPQESVRYRGDGCEYRVGAAATLPAAAAAATRPVAAAARPAAAASRFGYEANFELGSFPGAGLCDLAPASAPTLAQRFDAGCRILPEGLLKKTHWNGQYGIAVETPDDVVADGRVYVDLGDGRTLAFRVERVEACPIFGEGAKVELCCLSGAQSEDNGERGVVVDSDERGLLKVLLLDGRSVFARSVNLRSIPRDKPRRPINTSTTRRSITSADEEVQQRRHGGPDEL